MTWEWSHTAEAYRDAEINLRNMPIDELRVIWAEWKATFGCDISFDPQFCPDTYPEALTESQDMTAEQLANDIWERASELRSCTNGGNEAYMCPYGCGPHMVAFDTVHDHGNDYC